MYRKIGRICFIVIVLCCIISCERDFSEKTKIPIQFKQVFIPADNRVELIFDRSDFDIPSAEIISNYVVKSTSDSTTQAIDSVSVVGNRLAIMFNENLTTSQGYSIDVYNVTDKNGVPVAYSQQLIDFRVASVRFESASITPPNKIILNFNHVIDQDSINTNNFSLKIGETVLQPIQVDVNYYSVSLTFQEPFENGDYELTMTHIVAKNLAVIENKVYSFTYNGAIVEEDLPTQWFYFENIELRNLADQQGPNTLLYVDWDKGLTARYHEDIDYEISFVFDKYFTDIKGFYNSDQGGLFGLMVLDMPIEEVTDISPYIDKFYQTTSREPRFSSTQPYGFNYNDFSPYFLPWCIVDVEDPYALNYNIQRYNLPLYNNEVEYQYDPIHPIKIIPNRTIIFKTNRGKYGKMEMTSIYENNEQPEMVPYNYLYHLSFRGVVQQDGSTNLDIPFN